MDCQCKKTLPLGALWRLLQTESELPDLITSRGRYGAAHFNVQQHMPLLRPAAVFLPPAGASSAGSSTAQRERQRWLAGRPPPQTHPPVGPGAREVFPPTKVSEVLQVDPGLPELKALCFSA